MNISRLHYLSQDIVGKTHLQLIEEACLAKVSWVQLRMKNQEEETFLQTAKKARAITQQHKATLIINDNTAIAKEVYADGVHLGKEDMDIALARKFLGDDYIIGATCNTFEDIIIASKKGANYIGLGPYQSTTTKQKLSPILGVEGYIEILKKVQQQQIEIPIIAIGGITLTDIPPLISAGVYGIAVASLINTNKDKKEIVQQLGILLSVS